MKNTQINRTRLLEAPVARTLMRMALPTGYGVASRVEFFSLAALNALSAVIGPFIGQNLGAGQLERVKAGFKVSGHFSLYVGGFLFFVYLAFAGKIAAIFNADPQVIGTTALYLVVSAGLSVLEMFGFSVPLALLGSYLFGTVGVFTAIAFSYTATGLAALWTIRRELNATKVAQG